MATQTAKLNLRKPDPTDNVDVTTDISDNMQAIDDAFAGIVAAYRNKIRNGDMGVAQRGDGAFTANAVYTVDGWMKEHVGGTHSVTRSGITVPTAPVETKRYIFSVVATQSAAGDYAFLSQRIEGVETLAGKQVTLSFIAFGAAGTPKIGVEIAQNFGTGGAPSADVLTTVQAVTLSTGAIKYSVTFTIPSIAGKTLGTAGNDFLQLILWLSAGATFATRASNIGIQNATITIVDVQLEAGSVATAFERLPQQVQLAWCQRYFVRFEGSAGAQGHGVIGDGLSQSAALFRITVSLPVGMRARPVVSFAGSLSVLVGGAGAVGGTTVSSISAFYWSPGATSKVLIEFVPVAALTPGYPANLTASNAAGNLLDFSAEL